MISIFILTMVFQSWHGVATISTEYNSAAACEIAKQVNRDSLRDGNVLLATCTKK